MNITKSEQWYFHPEELIRMLRYFQFNQKFDPSVDYSFSYADSEKELVFGAVIYITENNINTVENQILKLKMNGISNILLYNNFKLSKTEISVLIEKYKIHSYMPETELWNNNAIGNLADLDVFYRGLLWANENTIDMLIKVNDNFNISFNIQEKILDAINISESITYANTTKNELNQLATDFICLYVQAWSKTYPLICLRFAIENELTVYTYFWLYELIKTLSGNNKSEKWIKFNNSLDYLHSGFHAIKS
jgi:hypothetical protein